MIVISNEARVDEDAVGVDEGEVDEGILGMLKMIRWDIMLILRWNRPLLCLSN